MRNSTKLAGLAISFAWSITACQSEITGGDGVDGATLDAPSVDASTVDGGGATGDGGSGADGLPSGRDGRDPLTRGLHAHPAATAYDAVRGEACVQRRGQEAQAGRPAGRIDVEHQLVVVDHCAQAMVYEFAW